jgi:transcriptional regulator with XRE-family HTH domain
LFWQQALHDPVKIKEGRFVPASSPPRTFDGAKLARLRHDRGLSLARLSMVVAIPQNRLWLWESGRATPTLANVVILADRLGVSLDDLLTP